MHYKIRSLALLIGLILFSFCANSTSGNGNSIKNLNANSFNDSLTTLQSNAQLLDVRTEQEFAGGHIEDAVNINWNGGEFEEKVKHLDMNKPVFVYCLSGGRSSSAAAKLKELGFKNIYQLNGGIRSWEGVGLPIEGLNENAGGGMSMEDFDALISKVNLVLVDFNAPWCAPCRRMAPMLDSLKEEYAGKVAIEKVNADEHKTVSKTLKVTGLPTLLLYKNKEVIWKHEGYIGRTELVDALNKGL